VYVPHALTGGAHRPRRYIGVIPRCQVVTITLSQIKCNGNNLTPPPLLLEIHVDDEVLQRDPARWEQAAALLDGLARRAEDGGGVLCFRIREPFARGDASADNRTNCGGFLRALQQRGHEIGWHAHGTGLARAVAALRATGVREPALVGAPGLVQTELHGGIRSAIRAKWVLEQAYLLGMRVLTDRWAHRAFGWQGRVPWTLELGAGRQILSLDVSADPFAWGVLRHAGGAEAQAAPPKHAHGDLDWHALDALIDRRDAEDPLPGSYFSATVHEHNFCAPNSLVALPDAMDAFSRWLERRGQRLRRATELVSPELVAQPCAPNLGRRSAASPPMLSRLRAVTRLQNFGKPKSSAEARNIPVNGPTLRTLRSLWFNGAQSSSINLLKGIVVAVHGGAGGCTQRLGFLGLAEDALTKNGWALVVFDRTPDVSRTPGNPIHVADTAAMIEAARLAAQGLPVHVLTWSAGLVPAVLSGLHGVARLIDVEGPVDRYSLVPPGQRSHELTGAEIFEDALWQGREAVDGIAAFTRAGGDYVRVQGSPDHVHGNVDHHAIVAIRAANAGRAGSATLLGLPGPVQAFGDRVLRAIIA